MSEDFFAFGWPRNEIFFQVFFSSLALVALATNFKSNFNSEIIFWEQFLFVYFRLNPMICLFVDFKMTRRQDPLVDVDA